MVIPYYIDPATKAPIQFEGFPKIGRLFRDIIITEKIDGTNAQVHILENGRVLPGSRKRYITPDKDNHGFAAWVEAHADELRLLGHGRHFGEWWGKGIQRGYGLDEKRFSLFNVSRWYDSRHDPGGVALNCFGLRTAVPSCCHVVPILYLGLLTTQTGIEVVKAVEKLREYGSVASPGFMQPEGIVVFHVPTSYLFKVTLESDGPKGVK